jgi:hypothetical protein
MIRQLRFACSGLLIGATVVSGSALAQPAGSRAAPDETLPSPRAIAPVDLTGYWVSVVTEDWAWRMRTPPKGDYASIPLNDAGRRVADAWTEDRDGSCLAFGAPAVLRMPTRARISWEDDYTLKLETDNGEQTRWLRFSAGDTAAAEAAASAAGVDSAGGAPTRAAAGRRFNDAMPARSLQGESRAEWQIVTVVTGSGADSGVVSSRLDEDRWAPLKVVTRNLSAGWLRPNGVPYSENAVLTEHFDWFREGDDAWFSVTTIVKDPTYLTEPLIISSNFKREPDGSKWNPMPCRQ